MIYLRPQPAATPVDYMRSLEKAGLMVLPRRQLAMYTVGMQGPAGGTGATGATGSTGTPGAPGSLFDTIIASASDETTAITVDLVNPKTTFRAPYAMDLTTRYIRASLTTAATGADFIIDVHMNGVTVFSTLLTIDATKKTSKTAAIPAVLSVTTIPDDAEFEVFVTQVGSTLAGAGLKVAVTGVKTA